VDQRVIEQTNHNYTDQPLDQSKAWKEIALQTSLCVTNVLGHLPLTIAVAHNGSAALLLLLLAIFF
jgi:hypothetical protein